MTESNSILNFLLINLNKFKALFSSLFLKENFDIFFKSWIFQWGSLFMHFKIFMNNDNQFFNCAFHLRLKRRGFKLSVFWGFKEKSIFKLERVLWIELKKSAVSMYESHTFSGYLIHVDRKKYQIMWVWNVSLRFKIDKMGLIKF